MCEGTDNPAISGNASARPCGSTKVPKRIMRDMCRGVNFMPERGVTQSLRQHADRRAAEADGLWVDEDWRAACHA